LLSNAIKNAATSLRCGSPPGKVNSLPRKKVQTETEDRLDLNLQGKITVGEFVERDREAYTKAMGVRT
jgi:hypothetical protein